MKALLIIQAFILATCPMFSLQNGESFCESTSAYASVLPSVQYLRVEESVPFYSDDGGQSCLFYLPATYYVALEDEGEEFDAVTYEDLHGFIRHGSCEKVTYEPSIKYAESGSIVLQKDIEAVKFYADANCLNKVADVSATDKLFLYGVSENSDIYYCRLHKSYGVIYGYLSDVGVTVTLPKENTAPVVAPPADDNPPSEENPELPSDDNVYESHLAVPVQIILIVSLAVPAFLLVFLLTRKNKKK